jgi:hypothetical protein
MTAAGNTPTQMTFAPTRRVFRTPAGRRYGSLIGVVILAATLVIMIALAALVAHKQLILGLTILPSAGIMGALVLYCWRDLGGKWGLRIVLDASAATFDLPANRSLIHRPPAQRFTIAYADIAAIESRFEGYRSLGQACMQRAYVLRPKRGEPVFLFEERALATKMQSADYASVVADLAARAGLAIAERGTVEGDGGLLGAWGTHAPDWAAAPLSRDRATQLWRDAAATGSAALSIVMFIAMVMWVLG